MKDKNNRRIVDNMLVFHDGLNTTYGAVVYYEDHVEWIKESKKYVQYSDQRLVKGPAIHAHMFKNLETRAFFVTLVRSAATLNRAILKLCEDETNRLLEKSKKKRKRR